MKTYYVHYYKDFRNTYDLYYAETQEDTEALPEGAKRITRKSAIQLCREERIARKYNPKFSGYAATVILPAICANMGCYEIQDDQRFELNGYILERVHKEAQDEATQ